jgi:hypothetical protein
MIAEFNEELDGKLFNPKNSGKIEKEDVRTL